MRFFAGVPSPPPLIRDLEMLGYYLSAHGVFGGVVEVLGITDDPEQSPIVKAVLESGERFNVHRIHYHEWLQKAKVHHEMVSGAADRPAGGDPAGVSAS